MVVMRRFAVAVASLALVAGSTVACALVEETRETVTLASSAQIPIENPELHWALKHLAGMTTLEKSQSVLMLHYPGTDAAKLANFVAEHKPGGMILMGDNIPQVEASLAQINASWNSNPELPILIAIDQEGGIVKRLKTDTTPGGSALRNAAVADTEAAFNARSILLNSLGVHINFGIVADYTNNSRSFIWSRVLGADPEAASDRVAAAVTGELGRVLSTLKHFPGHGATPADSHFVVPQSTVDKTTWLSSHAQPFIAGISAGAEIVMMGHLRFTQIDSLPASLSPEWHRILREELGFDGLIVSDDMLMLRHSTEFADSVKNAIAAIKAGSTMLVYVLAENPVVSGVSAAQLYTGIAAAVESGEISAEVLDAAVLRLILQRHSYYEDPRAIVTD